MPADRILLHMTSPEAAETMALWNECADARGFACRVLASVMNAYMDEQDRQACGAGRNVRSDGRVNSRNGYRRRSLKTAPGDVELDVPKPRAGSYFPEGMLRRWSRIDVLLPVT